MKKYCYAGLVAVVVAAFFALASAANATLLTMYDPVGPQNPDSSDLPAAVVLPSVTASNLHNGGGIHGNNINIRPSLAGSDAFNPATNHYFEFTLAPAAAGQAIQLSTIEYQYVSHNAGSTFYVSLLTSTDGFTTPVDTKVVNGPTLGLMVFNAATVPATTGPITIRFYLYGCVNGGNYGASPYDSVDWADISSTAFDPNSKALSINGTVYQPVAVQQNTLGAVKALYKN